SCHGQLVPEALAADTRIELTHRVTSALSGLLAIALPVWAWRLFPRGHGVRRASLALLVLIIIEGGIGAGLVLGRLVGENASALRASVVAPGSALARPRGRALFRINSRRLRECVRGGVRAARQCRAVAQSTDWTEPMRGSSAAGSNCRNDFKASGRRAGASTARDYRQCAR